MFSPSRAMRARKLRNRGIAGGSAATRQQLRHMPRLLRHTPPPKSVYAEVCPPRYRKARGEERCARPTPVLAVSRALVGRIYELPSEKRAR